MAGLYDTIKEYASAKHALDRIATAMESIAESQRRLADAAEGVTPPLVLDDPDPEPPTIADRKDDGFFRNIEAIEARFLAATGRLPTEEEVCAELDGLPIDPAVADAALKKRSAVPQ